MNDSISRISTEIFAVIALPDKTNSNMRIAKIIAEAEYNLLILPVNTSFLIDFFCSFLAFTAEQTKDNPKNRVCIKYNFNKSSADEMQKAKTEI